MRELSVTSGGWERLWGSCEEEARGRMSANSLDNSRGCSRVDPDSVYPDPERRGFPGTYGSLRVAGDKLLDGSGTLCWIPDDLADLSVIPYDL